MDEQSVTSGEEEVKNYLLGPVLYDCPSFVKFKSFFKDKTADISL